MPIHHKIEVMPFNTPNFVTLSRAPAPRGEMPKELPSLALSELSTETLEALCDQFRADVLRKAGKQTT